MPIIREIQDRLSLAFPRSADDALFRAVQEGSYLADHLFDGEGFLNNVVGRDIRGHVRRIGIAHQIELYCTRGDLPYIAAMKPMPKGRWHWLEISATGATAHVCRTDDVMAFPDEADSRQDARVSIQGSLFSWMGSHKPMAAVIEEIPRLYAWLTFRVGQDGRLSHLCWGAPAADTDTYVGHINVLEQLARAGLETPAVSTVPDPKEKLRLKDHVVQALGKTDKQAGE
jgi:hypothetical protein